MPVKSRSPLDTATKRLRLIPRGRPYLARIAKGKDLAYRRGPGSWSIHDNGKVKVFALADDHEPSNGKTILTFDEAMAMARKLLLPEDGAEASKLTTVSQALDLYAVDLQARKAAVYNARAPRVHLPPGLLSKPLALITDPAELKNWRNSLSKKGLASATVNRVCNCLRAALTLADKNRSHIWRSGLEKLPDGEVARNVVLTDDTVWAFVDACDQHDPGLGLFMDTLATTGARPSQAVRLKVHNFHDEDREPKLMMPPSAKGGGRNRSEKKHGKPYPVPITPALAVRLRLAVKGRPSHAPLLLRSNGVPWSEKNVHGEYRHDIRAVVEAIGLDPDTVTAYSLRHSSITRMLLLNTPVRVVAAHHNTSVAQIEKHYSHLITSHADELIRRTLLQRPTIKIAAE